MVNVLDLFFVNLAVAVTFTGILIRKFRKYMPPFIVKGFTYGSFAYQGNGADFLNVIEMPKSYYRHFYSFSSIFSVIMLIYMFGVYFLNYSVNYYVTKMLEVILWKNQPSISAMAAFLALSLLSVQCLRRFYETHYLQVFAKKSKMNLSHYFAGIMHYFACIVAIVGEAPLFCGDQNRENVQWVDLQTSILSLPAIIIFLWAWYEQYQTNIIFASMRRDKKSGEVVTEDHGIPKSRMFELISSPHRMCEIIMYTVLVLLVPTTTFVCIYLWVLSNQIQTALEAHEWYKKTFTNYPPGRMSVFPYIL